MSQCHAAHVQCEITERHADQQQSPPNTLLPWCPNYSIGYIGPAVEVHWFNVFRKFQRVFDQLQFRRHHSWTQNRRTRSGIRSQLHDQRICTKTNPPLFPQFGDDSAHVTQKINERLHGSVSKRSHIGLLLHEIKRPKWNDDDENMQIDWISILISNMYSLQYLFLSLNSLLGHCLLQENDSNGSKLFVFPKNYQ